MEALIIYDSFFGNTKKIAETVADILKAKTMRITEISLEDLKGINLLIVGSPTRAFRPSPETTAFLDKLPDNVLKGTKVAAYDTRIDQENIKSAGLRTFLGCLVSVFGYAAKPMVRKLVSKGGVLVGEPVGFYVEDTKGPLRKGETEKAKDWAKEIKNKI